MTTISSRREPRRDAQWTGARMCDGAEPPLPHSPPAAQKDILAFLVSIICVPMHQLQVNPVFQIVCSASRCVAYWLGHLHLIAECLGSFNGHFQLPAIVVSGRQQVMAWVHGSLPFV